MVVHPEGRIIDKKYQWMQNIDFEELILKSDLLPRNKELLSGFIRDARLGKTIKKRQKKRIGRPRLMKYYQDLSKLDGYFRKPLDEVTQADMERFITDLEEGRYCKKPLKGQRVGDAYSSETQVCIKKVIIKFYKWLLGDGKEVPELVEWIDTSSEDKQFCAVSRGHFESMRSRMVSNTPLNLTRNKALVTVLFDSGCRADELLNVRIRDLDFQGATYKLSILYSKTKSRTVLLPLSKEFLDEWLDLHPLRDNPLAQLFPVSYVRLCRIVKSAARSIGRDDVTPHGLRKSSATYWANRLSRYQLCYRFGWSLHSREPDRYVDAAALEQQELAESVLREDDNRVRDELRAVREELSLMQERYEELLRSDRDELQSIIEDVKHKSRN
ncbi:site-specific integrase [Candidatus Woesearchaeota archaeon]|nr:site-specific integrase [Candidatus Woesearchaeota archaeon]